MSLNLTRVKFLHRPLAIYAGVLGLSAVAGAYMRWLGFRHFTQAKIGYWYRPATLTPQELANHTPRADPLVLIHGIGIGAFTYLHLMRKMCRTVPSGGEKAKATTSLERSVYVLELPYIAMTLGADDVPSPSEHVQAMADMLYSHEMDEREADAKAAAVSAGIKLAPAPSPRPSLDEVQQSSRPIKALIVSHSYGTFVSAWLVKYRSDLVASVVLIDPVCFMVSVATGRRDSTQHMHAHTAANSELS